MLLCVQESWFMGKKSEKYYEIKSNIWFVVGMAHNWDPHHKMNREERKKFVFQSWSNSVSSLKSAKYIWFFLFVLFVCFKLTEMSNNLCAFHFSPWMVSVFIMVAASWRLITQSWQILMWNTTTQRAEITPTPTCRRETPP